MVAARNWRFLYTYGPRLSSGDMHQLSATPQTRGADRAFLGAVHAALAAPIDNPGAFFQYTDPATMKKDETMRWRWHVKNLA